MATAAVRRGPSGPARVWGRWAKRPALAAAALAAATLAAEAILARGGPGESLPWVQPTAESVCVVAGGAVAYLCLERHRARRAPLAWWVGLVFTATLVLNVFYVLTFPGLVDGRGVVGTSLSTSAYFFTAQYALLGVGISLAALGARRRLAPQTGAGLLATFAVTLVAALALALAVVWLAETGRLPPLVGEGGFRAPQASLNRLAAAAILVAAALLTPLTAGQRPWLSRPLLLCLALLGATCLATEFPLQRYDAGWYAVRVVRPLAFGLVLVALLGEYARLFSDERRRADTHAGLAAAAGELAALQTPEEIVRVLGQRLRTIAGGDRSVAVFLLDRSGGPPDAPPSARPAFAEGAVAGQIMALGPRPTGEGLIGHVLGTGRPYAASDPDVAVGIPVPGAPDRPGAVLAVPVVGRHPLGVAILTRRERLPYDDLQIEAALLFAHQAAAALERAYQAQAVDRMKSEFVSLVSHELRTPLTSIKGYVDLLLDGEAGEVPAEQREFLEIVKRNADCEVALVNDLLDLSRLEAGRLELRRTRLHLDEAIRAACTALQPQLEARRLTLRLAVAAHLPPVWADSNRIAQVLTNLLSNACKYTPSGGQVTVRALPDGHRVRVDVQDTGIGLSPEELSQLFTRFFRSRSPAAEEAGGTGLGLAISRQLVELHGGEITVDSAPGRGSTFSVFLPIAPTATPARQPPVGPVGPVGPEAPAPEDGGALAPAPATVYPAQLEGSPGTKSPASPPDQNRGG